ncbi:MAG: DUF1007 family protein [Nitrospinota bacterium]
MTRLGRFLLILASLVLGAGSSIPAQAHPHVWITNATTFLFQGDKLVGVRLEWTFDELFSDTLIREFDENKNRQLDPKEVQQIEADTFPHLKKFHFFTHILLDKKKVTVNEVHDFSATVVDKETVRYRLTVRLPEPVDPRRVPVTVNVYDDSYYVDFIHEKKDPVRIEGARPGACTHRLGKSILSVISGWNMLTPTPIHLECGGR